MKLVHVANATASLSNALDGVRNAPSGAAYVVPPRCFPQLLVTSGTLDSQDKAALNAFKLGIKKQLMSRSANRPSIGPSSVGSAHGGSRPASNASIPDVATNAMYQSLIRASGQSPPLYSRRSLNLTLVLQTISGSPFGWFTTSLTYNNAC
jgi:hypothetical protein